MYLQNLQWVWAGESNTGRRYVLAEPAVGVGRGEQYREKVCTCRTCSGCGPGRAIQGEGMYLQNLQWVWAGESNTGRRYVLAEPAVGVGRGEQYREKVWYVLAEPAVGVGRGEQYREKVCTCRTCSGCGPGRAIQGEGMVCTCRTCSGCGQGRAIQGEGMVCTCRTCSGCGQGRAIQGEGMVCTCRTCSGCEPGRAIQGEGMYLQLQWVWAGESNTGRRYVLAAAVGVSRGEQYREKVCTCSCSGCGPGRAIQGEGMYLQLQWVWAGESNTGRRYVLAEPAVGVSRGEQYREKVCTCSCSGCGPGRAIQGEGMYLQNLQWVWAGESNTGRRYVLAEPAVGVGRGEQEKVCTCRTCSGCGPGRAIQGEGMYLQNLQWVWAGESNTGRK